MLTAKRGLEREMRRLGAFDALIIDLC